MNSVSTECQELKTAYDSCFNSWFKEEFLKGSTRDSCSVLFKSYQDCVKKAIDSKGIKLWEVEKDVLGTEDEKQQPTNK